MNLKEELKRLDWNGDGKIDIEDARAFTEEKLDRHGLKVMGWTAAVCLFGGFLIGRLIG